MNVFENVSPDSKSLIIHRWKEMSDQDKDHFINQVSLAMSVWGSSDKGKKLVSDIMVEMVSNGSSTLADFGLYVENAIDGVDNKELKEKIKRASAILDGYRIKHALPSEPHRDIGI